MVEALIAAGSSIMVGGLALIGVIITNNKSNTKMQNDMKIAQVRNDERLSELTREVRMHNDFALKIPRLEEQIKSMNERISHLQELVDHMN